VALPRFSVLLRLERTTRRNLPALLLAMLAFAVFAWGLHYKLSLYRSETVQHRGPEAKLLSQRERPVPCTQMQGPLLSGRFAPRIVCRILRDTAAALPAYAYVEISDRYLGGANPQSGPNAKRFRFLVPCNPRGPPTAV
jgi:hypothetical protein